MIKIAKRGFIVNTVDTEVCSRFRDAIHQDHLAFGFEDESCIQDTLPSRARLAECVARAKVSCIQG